MSTSESAKPLEFVVTGATGQQGSALARILLARGDRVRALTRRIDSAAARGLAQAGAHLVRADLDTGEGVDEAIEGANGLFLVTTPFERGAAAEIDQARHAGRAAARAKVPHVVYSSVTRSMTFSPVEHFAAKGEAERMLQGLGLPLTVLGATPFADNLVAPWHLPWLQRGIFALPVPDEFPMQMVLTRDIAAVAAHVLQHPERFVGERLDLATEATTGRAILAALEAATGKHFDRQSKSFAELDPLLGKLFAGVDLGAPRPTGARSPAPEVDIEALRARLPEVRWSTVAAWVAELDWTGLLGGARA